MNGSGLITLNRREHKDAFYLYKAMWNRQEPTLHIVDKRRRLRDNDKTPLPRLFVGGHAPLCPGRSGHLAMTEYAPCQYRTDSVSLKGIVHLKTTAGNLCDSVTIFVGNVLKPKRSTVLRRTTGPQTTN